MAAQFKTPKQRHIAALLSVGPLGAAEIRSIVGGDKTTLRRGLERLRDRGLLVYVDSDGASAPGRPAGLWSLTADGRAAAAASSENASEDHELTDAPTGSVERGQFLVRVTVDRDNRRALDDLLSRGELTAAAAWVARLDGDASEYLIAFDRDVGEQPGENLVAALGEMGLDVEAGSVRFARPAVEFIDLLRTAKEAASRAIEPRDQAT